LSSYTGAAQDVEIDWFFKDATYSASGESIGFWQSVPSGWGCDPGTLNGPTGTNFDLYWSTAWDVATSTGGGAGETYYAVQIGDPTYYPNSPDSYSIYWNDHTNSAWDMGKNKGAYDDGVAGNPGDQDGMADTMGTDFIVHVPGGLSPGTTWDIVVEAIGHTTGGTKASSTATITIEIPSGPADTDPPVFGGITGAADAATDGEVTLSWSAATDASPPITYNIYWSTTSGGQNFGAAPQATSSNSTGDTVSGLTNGQIYYFVVRAEDSASTPNESANLQEQSATPTDGTPPTFGGITGATNAGTGGAVDLTWSAATDPSTPITYNIYWSTTSGGQNFGAAPQATSSSGTGDTVTGLTDDQIYYFVVRAEDSATNESSNLEEQSATPTAPDTTPPTFGGITGATDAGTGGAVDLTWSAASDPSTPITYNIYWSTTSGGQNFGAAPQATCTNPGCDTGDTVTGLTDDQIYYFVVRAEDNFTNESTNLEEQSATPTAPDSTPPTFGGITGATDTTTGGTVDLTWSAASDPSTPITYNIYWSTTSGGQNFGAAPQATCTNPGCDTGDQVTGLTDDQIYYFVVRAEDSPGNESSNLQEQSATPTTTDTTPPTFGGVTGATDTGAGGTVDLTWSAASDPSTPITYNIYWSTTSGGQNFVAAPQATCTNPGCDTGDTVTGLTDDQIYYFVVRAEDNATNESTNLQESSATPTTADVTAPSSTITDPTNGSTINSAYPVSYTITGTASDVGGSVTEVEVLITPGGTWQTANGTTSWDYTWNLSADGTYTIQSRATDDASPTPNVETPGAGITVTVDRNAPTFSGITGATDPASGGVVDLTWDAATETISPPVTYNIYYATTSGGQNFSTPDATSSNATGDSVTALTNDQIYYFVVKAVDDAGNESASPTELSATPTAPASCEYFKPSVTILTADKDITFDGGLVKYTVRVLNNDTATCSPTPFTLTVVDSNSTNFYASTVDINPLTVSPQSFAETTIQVAAKPNQTNGWTNATYFYTESDGNHPDPSDNSNSVTTTINVTGIGCVTNGDYVNSNGDQFIISR
jgi:hypothetical protein